MSTLHVVGVRHHSPACARLVAHAIRTKKPRFVLIEGPSDMNERIAELGLGHDLPIAIFSYAHGAELHHASWSPFCAYSPEWVALEEAKKIGAEALFIDLPAWHKAFSEVANRYSDRHSRASDRMRALCQRLGVEDVDSLWDHLFEQPLEPATLETRLQTYFRELRQDDDCGERDRQRETYMCRWIAWALEEAGGANVVVVCGGYHAPVLETAWKEADRARPEIPELELGIRLGSYLVPYSFHRLDSFVGYESGMPSPEFYQQVWETGAQAGETMLFSAISHLRAKKQRVSPADAIAAMTLARGIQTLRGHTELLRVDVLDGLAGAVVKDALEAPLPWNRRGVLARGTDPMLVEMVAAFSGERTGRLAPGTPRPPLAQDVEAELARVGVLPKRTKEKLTLDLTDAKGLERSRVLHRLRVLDVPGFVRERAPSLRRGSARNLGEVWTVFSTIDAEPAIVEAAAYGATLEAAAAAKLETLLREAPGLRGLAKVLREAAHVGIATLATRVATDARRVAGVEPDFSALGGALADLVDIYRHDVLLGAAGAPIVGETIEAAFDRGLWLFEAIDGKAGAAEVDGAVALRDSLREAGGKLALDGARAAAVMRRRAKDPTAPPAVRGAALGFSWSTRDPVTEEEAIAAVKGAGRPDTLGDFLTGLFGLAREEVLHTPAVLEVVDGLVQPMTRDDFLIAIPSLRLAFSYFPPQERATIAKRALGLHGAAGRDARTLTKLDVSPETTIAGMRIDGAAKELALRYGLTDGYDDE